MDLQPSPMPPSSLTPPSKSRWVLWLALVLLAVGLSGVAVWQLGMWPRAPAPVVAVEPDAGVDAGPAHVSLDEGEALLKRLGATWSPEELWKQWLSTNGLLRLVVGAVSLAADGQSPRPMLPFLSVPGEFSVRELGKPVPKLPRRAPRRPPNTKVRLFVDERSYERYDALARVVSTVSPELAGRSYAELRPYLEAAYQEIGRPGTHFDDALARAIAPLLVVEFPTGEVELLPHGVVYAFKDPALESLTAPQKHLLRMGPKNGRAVQDGLRSFAQAAVLSLPGADGGR